MGLGKVRILPQYGVPLYTIDIRLSMVFLFIMGIFDIIFLFFLPSPYPQDRKRKKYAKMATASIAVAFEHLDFATKEGKNSLLILYTTNHKYLITTVYGTRCIGNESLVAIV